MRAPEKIHVVVLALDPRLFFRAVADAEVYPLMLAFRDGDARAHLGIVAFGIQRFDVDELKQLHSIQPPLRILHDAAAVQVAGPVRQLSSDHVLSDAAVAHDFDRTEVREGPGFCGEGEGDVAVTGAFGG